MKNKRKNWGSVKRLKIFPLPYGSNYPVVIDPEGEIYKKFGAGSVPYHILIDKNFIIRHSEKKFNRDHLIQFLDSYLQEEI